MLKTLLTLPLLLAIAAPVAQASDLRMTIEKPHFTCEGHGKLLSHVAYRPGDDSQDVDQDAPLPCCDGQIGCAQFLSTSTVVRPAHPLRG